MKTRLRRFCRWLKAWIKYWFAFIGISAFIGGYPEWPVGYQIVVPVFLVISFVMIITLIISRTARHYRHKPGSEAVVFSAGFLLGVVSLGTAWVETFIHASLFNRCYYLAGTTWLFWLGWRYIGHLFLNRLKMRPYDPERHNLRPVDDQVEPA